jgi:hypothetical protein
MVKKSVGKFDSKKWLTLLTVIVILSFVVDLVFLNVLYDIQKSESNLKGELAQTIGSSCSGNADCPSTGCLGNRLMRIACISGTCDYGHKIGECNSASTDSYYSKSEPDSDYYEYYTYEPDHYYEEGEESPYDGCEQTVTIGYPKNSCKYYAVQSWASCLRESCIKKVDCIIYYTEYGLSHGASSTDIERFKYRCLSWQEWRNDMCGYELKRELYACDYVYPLREEDYVPVKEEGDDSYKIKSYDYYIQ